LNPLPALKLIFVSPVLTFVSCRGAHNYERHNQRDTRVQTH
jgi:hypothetical protein